MKILYLIDTLAVGGTETSLAEIVARLPRGMRIVVCSIYPGDALRRRFEEGGARVVALDLPHRYGFLAAARQVRRLVAAEEPDLIHCSLFRAGIVGRLVARWTGVPLIDSFVNDSYAARRWASATPVARAKLAAVRALDRWTAGAVHRFTANSAAVRDANCAALGVARERVTVIYRGRDPGRFAEPGRAAFEAARAELNLAAGTPAIVHVGRLLERKGQLELVRALAVVRREHSGTVLLIAGEGPWRPRLQAEAERLAIGGAVRLLGTRSDVPVLLHLGSVFAFPSHYEGHPGALVEAMFAGRPIVASDIGPHREAIAPGESGWLVPAGDPAALAGALGEALRDPAAAARRGAAARAAAMRRFDVAAIAAEHAALYAAVTGRSAPGTAARREAAA